MSAIGSDFITRVAMKAAKCSECGRQIPAGTRELVSIRKGKVQKRVCSEDCRLEFDARFWEQRADDRRGA